MSKESKRTEGELAVVEDELGGFSVVYMLNGFAQNYIAKDINETNAYKIVKAWNNHDGLVEALRGVVEAFDLQHGCDCGEHCSMCDVVDALKEAEGKTE